MSNFFSGVQFIPGVGHVEVGGTAPLGDDASVMMISGLSASPAGATQYDDHRNIEVDPVTGNQTVIQNPMMVGTLGRKVTLLGIELPVWAWILIGLGLLGAGWVFFKDRK